MEESTITSKGQIVVPARLRRRYGLKPGTKVYFIERNDEILFQPQTKEFIRSVHGMLASDLGDQRASRGAGQRQGAGRRPKLKNAVLDSYAVLAFLFKEGGTKAVLGLLEGDGVQVKNSFSPPRIGRKSGIWSNEKSGLPGGPRYVPSFLDCLSIL